MKSFSVPSLANVKAFFVSPKGLLVLGGVFVLLAGGLLAYTFRGLTPKREGAAIEQAPPQPNVTTYRHPLTGAPLTEPLKDLPRVFAVMIDHSADALPQSGG